MTVVELRKQRPLGATMSRRPFVGISRIAGHGKSAAGKDGVASLAYDLGILEQVLDSEGRTLPFTHAFVICVR